jgi:hypothetical protein
MDTDKDFIHIDEVFRKLRDHEEKEPPGAWLNMKDLLDKQLPVSGPAISAGRSFRRYIIPLATILLLGGGAATYYNLNKEAAPLASGTSGSHTLTASDAAKSAALTASGEHAPTIHRGLSGNNTVDPNGYVTPSNEVAAGPAPSAATRIVPDNIAGLSSRAANEADGGQGTRSATNNVTTDKSDNTLAVKHDASATNTTAASATRPGTRPGPGAKISGQWARQTTEPTKPRNSEQNLRPAVAIQTGDKVIEQQNVIERIAPAGAVATTDLNKSKSSSTDATITPATTVNTQQISAVASALKNKKIVQTPDGKMYREERDTFKRVDLTERYALASGNNPANNRKIVVDTVAITRIEKIRYVPLSKLELVALQKISINNVRRNVIPVSRLREETVASEYVSMVPLNNFKVSSKKVAPGKLNEFVRNTSTGLTSYFDGSRNFYMAVMAGGNIGFGNPGAFGIQLGLAGLYSIGERLTLSAELKFANHYFNNYTIDDASTTYGNITATPSGNSWHYNGTAFEETRSYNISHFNTLEMPLTLAYNLGRVSVFGGLNMAYAFPMNWTMQSSYAERQVDRYTENNKNPFTDAGGKIDREMAFASRFGLGYVAGASYDLSRKVSIDARISQVLTGDATIGGMTNLFRMPVMQFSLNYYFGRKDKVFYILDQQK